MAENEQTNTEIKTEPVATEAKETAPKSEKNDSPKKSAKKPRRRPSGKFGAPAPKNNAPFSDTLADRFGEALSNKLKRGIEDDIKRKIKAAQSDPAVQRASAKFGK
jgi:hypothetical protein